jgi:Asp/Glu/hydantoin racemase
MSRTLALLHTTSATLPVFKELAAQCLPGLRVIHLLDDSLLSEVMAAGDVTPNVEKRLAGYVSQAKLAGADAVMSCCSTIGLAMEKIGASEDIPVWRIDEAMAETAVRTGKRILILATAKTTLGPTAELILRQARISERPVEVESLWVEGALQALQAGNQDLHDRLVLHAMQSRFSSFDVIVLAQASMAGLLKQLGAPPPVPVLTSPVSGLESARKRLG